MDKKSNKNIDSKSFKSSSNTTHSKQTDSDHNDDGEVINVDDNEEVHEDVSDDDYDSDISEEHDFSHDDSTSYILSVTTHIVAPSLRRTTIRRNINSLCVLDRNIRNQIQLENIEIIRSAHEQSVKSVKLNNAVLDFRIRWNTTYIMISRFIALGSIITNITLLPSIEIDLKKGNIAAFLDPTAYRYLTDEDSSEAERILLSEFDVTQLFDRLQIDTSVTTMMSMSTSRPLGHQSTQNSTTSQEKSTLDEFFRMCEMPSASNITTNSIKKQLSFKEELCHYMSTAGSSSKFSEYWCQHELLLPQLSQFVKRYNCISATSVPSESAFSIGVYLRRKARSSLSPTALRYPMILREQANIYLFTFFLFFVYQLFSRNLCKLGIRKIKCKTIRLFY
ncbi:unnamed protein product [Rotaria socialis]|uniref:HAT C-terminal dimerisation domain-containing protein n=1 Tax=Rotaria socialis TaxID=392032 RepID=A0A818AU99_9BILA|nr:unnamed protein product [Rotaria socialis]